MKFLVTGKDGQVGKALQQAALPAGVALSAFGIDELDIGDAQGVAAAIAEISPSAVINAAAYTDVDGAEAASEGAYLGNRDGPANLARACSEAAIPLLHISTDYVFGEIGKAEPRPYLETDAPHPVNVYGASKLAGDIKVQELASRHIILRTSWVYSAVGNNFVLTMLRLGAEREELSVVDDQVGSPTSAPDIAAALITAAVKVVSDNSTPNGIFNFTATGQVSWCGFADAIFDEAMSLGLLSRRPRVKPIPTSDYPTPARRPPYSVLNTSKISETFGVSIRPWRDSLRDVLNEIRASH